MARKKKAWSTARFSGVERRIYIPSEVDRDILVGGGFNGKVIDDSLQCESWELAPQMYLLGIGDDDVIELVEAYDDDGIKRLVDEKDGRIIDGMRWK